MAQYAVGLANFYDNDLQVYTVFADDWRDAIIKAMSIESDDDNTKEWMKKLPNTEDEVKQEFFDGDMLVGWKQL